MGKPQRTNPMMGLQPISRDKQKSAQLEEWCDQQSSRRRLADMQRETKGQFQEFSTQSLARKMAVCFDRKFGPGNDTYEDPADSLPNELMSSARMGAGINQESGVSSGKVTPSVAMASGLDGMAEKAPLYSPGENKHEPFMSVFTCTHDDAEGNPVDYIGVTIVAGDMVKPTGTVEQDGRMLEVVSGIPTVTFDTQGQYKAKQESYMEVMGDKQKPARDREYSQRKYNRTEALRTAENKSHRQMKVVKGAKWKYQITRVPLEVQVEKKIESFYTYECPEGNGKVLKVALKVKQDDVHIDAITAKEDIESPTK